MISDNDKKSSLSKTIVSPKSTQSPKKSSKVIDINNEDYVVTYRVTEKYDYPVFKIENKNGTISCFGTFDNQINATQLLKLNYDVKTIIMNDCKYHLIVAPTFDGFVTPVIISTIDHNLTVAYFMDIFQDIIHGIIF